jgi:hypothetical protein
MNRPIEAKICRKTIIWSVRITYIMMIAVVFGMVSSGCSPFENRRIGEEDGIADSGFFTGQPCGPPCLWGITPGLTTVGGVLDVLKEKGMSNECDQFDNSQEAGGRGVICRGSVVFSVDGEIVEGIGFNPSQEITVAEVIEQYGEPNSVRVVARGVPEYPHTVMILFFDSIRTDLVLPEQEGIIYRVEATTAIENIGYSSDTTYKPSSLPYPDWVGYGEYQRYP